MMNKAFFIYQGKGKGVSWQRIERAYTPERLFLRQKITRNTWTMPEFNRIIRVFRAI